MAVKREDGSILMTDGRVIFANTILIAEDLLELIALFSPPPAFPFFGRGGGGGGGGFGGSGGPGAAGAAGPAGAAGAQGNQGPQGGDQGAVLAWGGSSGIFDHLLRYELSGLSATATSLDTRIRAPRAGTLRNLIIERSSAPPLAATVVIRVNGIASALTATILSLGTTGSNFVTSVAVAQGDVIEAVQTPIVGNAFTAVVGFD